MFCCCCLFLCFVVLVLFLGNYPPWICLINFFFLRRSYTVFWLYSFPSLDSPWTSLLYPCNFMAIVSLKNQTKPGQQQKHNKNQPRSPESLWSMVINYSDWGFPWVWLKHSLSFHRRKLIRSLWQFAQDLHEFKPHQIPALRRESKQQQQHLIP